MARRTVCPARASRLAPFAEQRRSHPHAGGAFLYGHFQIVRHAHRKPAPARAVPPVPAAGGNRGATPPASSDHGGMVISPVSRKLSHPRTASINCRQFRRGGAALGLLRRKASLRASPPSAARPRSGDAPAWANPRSGSPGKVRRLSRFIGLQMADEMKARALQLLHLGRLAFDLPHVVLAELAQPQRRKPPGQPLRGTSW